ncbi:hypothetical protein KUV46_15850 [Thalassovita mediterranea]|nr:hypothetical protein KUV46_15850 [Thalassovita mediterranea]
MDWLESAFQWCLAHWFELIVIFLLERCFHMLYEIRNEARSAMFDVQSLKRDIDFIKHRTPD